jgi:hypothetical protein
MFYQVIRLKNKPYLQIKIFKTTHTHLYLKLKIKMQKGVC